MNWKSFTAEHNLLNTNLPNDFPSSPPVGIILLNWNGWEDTRACLESLERLEYPAARTIVVDNASSDGSPDKLQERFPGLDLIRLNENTGYVGGNNIGVQYAKKMGARYVLLLNNDTEVAPDFLSRVVETAESAESIGMVGPMIYYHKNPEVIWSAGGEVDRRSGDACMLGLNEIDRGQYGQSPRAVDWVTGCAILVKMSVIDKIGMLDSRFFAYYEDAEWCARARRAGYAVLHDPRARVWHKISRQLREASPQVKYYMVRNRLLYLKLTRNGALPWLSTLVVDDLRTLVSWSLKPKWRKKASQRRALLQAIRDFIQNRFGKVDVADDERAAS